MLARHTELSRSPSFFSAYVSLCLSPSPARVSVQFDRLLLIRSGGEEVFAADLGQDAVNLVDYFESSSSSTPPARLPLGQNPANWVLDVIADDTQDWAQLWKNSALKQAELKELQSSCQPSSYDDNTLSTSSRIHHHYVGQFERYKQVQIRYFIMHWRNAATNLSRVILMTCLGLILGLIYLDTNKTSLQGVISFESVIFLGISFPAAISTSSAFPSFFRQRAVYYRESTVGMYNYWIYSTALALVELPYVFFALGFFVLPFYFMVGMVHDASLFFQFYLVVFLQASIYSFLSQLWMALCPSQVSSNILDGVCLALFFMFGGLYIKASAIPVWWKWFYYIDPIPKSFIAALLPQLYCNGDANNPACPTLTTPTGQITVYRYVADQIEGAVSEYWPMIGWLLLIMGVIRILNLIALKYISHIKR